MMRKLKRSIARANMIREGYERINKKTSYFVNGKPADGQRSIFSRKWREYVK